MEKQPKRRGIETEDEQLSITLEEVKKYLTKEQIEEALLEKLKRTYPDIKERFPSNE